jgi:uncharacterized Zn finger protein (UPF0148 family)
MTEPHVEPETGEIHHACRRPLTRKNGYVWCEFCGHFVTFNDAALELQLAQYLREVYGYAN